MRLVSAVFVLVMLGSLAGCSGTDLLSGAATDMAGAALDCSLSAKIGVLMIGDNVQACYRDSSIHISVENLGMEDIAGIRIYVDSVYDSTLDLFQQIPSGGVTEYSVDFGSQKLGEVDAVELTPFMIHGEEPMICPGARVALPIARCV